MAELAAAAEPFCQGLQVGDVVEGRVVSVGSRGFCVDIGSGSPQHESLAFLPEAGAPAAIGVGDDLTDLCVDEITFAGEVMLSLVKDCATHESTRRGLARGHSGRGRGRGAACRGPGAASDRYEREQLLLLRQRHQADDEAPAAAAGALSVLPYSTEELDASLHRLVSAGALPPRAWHRCSGAAKRRALLLALRQAHMHIVFAMQPQSDHFRDELSCEDADEDFLREAMAALCADASTAGLEAPAGEPVSWLLERGAPAEALLPRSRTSACLAGLRLLAELGPCASAAAREVLACLAHGDVRVRRAAAEVLGGMGQAAATKDVLFVLRGALRDADPRGRHAAAEALGRLGPGGLAAAAQLLGEDDIERRGLAAAALGAGGAQSAQYAEVLTSWLLTEESPLRLAAVQALGSIGEAAGPASAAALAECLRAEADEHVREAAAVSLGRLGKSAAVHLEAIVGALDDAHPFVQQAAAAALESVSHAASL